MKIAYITAQVAGTDCLDNENFIIPEIIEIFKSEDEILLLPMGRGNQINLNGEVDPEVVLKNTLAVPFISRGVLLMGIILFLRNPLRSIKLIWRIITQSGGFKMVFKNLSLFFSGLTLSEVVNRNNVDHIHAADAAISSTCAYIAASISGISWSFTANGSRIEKNNIFRQKCKSAKFVRITDEAGYIAAVNIAGDIINEKCKLLEYNKTDSAQMVNRLLELMK